jgi:hypothetical protein
MMTKINIAHGFDIKNDLAVFGNSATNRTSTSISVVKIVTYWVSGILVQYPHLTFIAEIYVKIIAKIATLIVVVIG